MTRRFTSEIVNEIGPEMDIPAPDVGTTPAVMAWIFDTYSMNQGHSVLGVVTGKPLAIGGSLGREEATARGCLFCLQDTLKRTGQPAEGLKVAVQGFGNVGSVTADLLQKQGCKIVAIGDRSGALHDPNGIDVGAAITHYAKHKSLEKFKAGKRISNDELLTLEVDVLVPAALENVITGANAKDIRAKIICEGANGPTTAEAESILDKKGVFVIPDILANAGGVTVSYFEWVQDRGGYFWDEETVNRRLETIMVHSFGDVLALSKQHKVNMRTAAYVLAVSRVANVHRLRGIFA
jgi:glutamate dehydrogenase (NAD(P)+)